MLKKMRYMQKNCEICMKTENSTFWYRNCFPSKPTVQTNVDILKLVGINLRSILSQSNVSPRIAILIPELLFYIQDCNFTLRFAILQHFFLKMHIEVHFQYLRADLAHFQVQWTFE